MTSFSLPKIDTFPHSPKADRFLQAVPSTTFWVNTRTRDQRTQVHGHRGFMRGAVQPKPGHRTLCAPHHADGSLVMARSRAIRRTQSNLRVSDTATWERISGVDFSTLIWARTLGIWFLIVTRLRSAGWLAGWLVGWLVGGWVGGRLAGWLVGWLNAGFVCALCQAERA